MNTFLNIIFQNHHNLHVIKILKLFNRIHIKHIYKYTPSFSGYAICTYNRSKIKIGTNMKIKIVQIIVVMKIFAFVIKYLMI